MISTTKINTSTLQIEEDFCKTEKKLKEADAFDKIGQVAVEKGCLKVNEYRSEIYSLKQKTFNILPPLLGGLGLLGLSAAVAAISLSIIFLCPLSGLITCTIVLFPITFFTPFGFGVGFTIISAVDFADKHQTQNKLIKLYDKLDQANEHLKNNAEKIRNWIEVQRADIQSKLKANENGKILNLDFQKLRERSDLCTRLTIVLPKIAVASK